LRGPALLEIDMTAIGPFSSKAFAAPPVRKVTTEIKQSA